MRYHFVIDVTPFDFFKMSMKKTYRSLVGMCNIVFTVAAIALTVRFYFSVSDLVQLLLVIMCLIFPLIQPLGVYLRSKSLAARIPLGLTLDVGEGGITVSLADKSEKIEWKRVRGLIDNEDMLVLRVDGNNGYFLTNRVLGEERDSFIKYVRYRLESR